MEQLPMTDMQAIASRRSTRSYLDTPLGDKQAAHMQAWIDRLNKSHGLQMRLVEDASDAFSAMHKTYGMFRQVRSIIMLQGDDADPDVLEKCGMCGERLVLEATKLGLGVCWVATSFDHKKLQILPGETFACLLAIGHPSRPEPFMARFVRSMSHRKPKTMDDMYDADMDVPTWFLVGMESVTRAPSAMNTQKPRFHYRNNIVTADIHDTIPTDMVDLGIAKFHFETVTNGRFTLGNPGTFIRYLHEEEEPLYED